MIFFEKKVAIELKRHNIIIKKDKINFAIKKK